MATNSGVSEKITFARELKNINEQIKINVKTDCPCEQIKRVVSVIPEVRLNKKEILEDGLRLKLTLTFYICYIDLEGEIRKCECGNLFDTKLPLSEKCDRVFVSPVVEKHEVDLSGINLSVTGYVGIKVRKERDESVSALVGGEGLIVRRREFSPQKTLGIKEGILPLNEEIELGYSAKEVLVQKANVVITSAIAGVGVIIVDGKVNFSTILLQSGEKKDIIKEKKTIPFRYEIECDDAMPNFSAVASGSIKSLKTEISVDQEKDISLINAEISVRIEAECFKEESINLACDLFSLTHQTDVKRYTFDVYNCGEMRSILKTFNLLCQYDQVEDCSLIGITGENAEILTYSLLEDGVAVTGIFNGILLFKTKEGELISRKIESPFEERLEINENITDCKIDLCITDISARETTRGEVDVCIEATFSVYPKTKRQMGVITEVGLTDSKPLPKYPLSIYIGKAGEDEWDLAKRLNVSPENLIETNKELVFPLTGEERIVIYRQKK